VINPAGVVGRDPDPSGACAKIDCDVAYDKTPYFARRARESSHSIFSFGAAVAVRKPTTSPQS
jgi:hypothetical protein